MDQGFAAFTYNYYRRIYLLSNIKAHRICTHHYNTFPYTSCCLAK